MRLCQLEEDLRAQGIRGFHPDRLAEDTERPAVAPLFLETLAFFEVRRRIAFFLPIEVVAVAHRRGRRRFFAGGWRRFLTGGGRGRGLGRGFFKGFGGSRSRLFSAAGQCQERRQVDDL